MNTIDVIQGVVTLAKEWETSLTYIARLERMNVELQEEVAHLRRERDWKASKTPPPSEPPDAPIPSREGGGFSHPPSGG